MKDETGNGSNNLKKLNFGQARGSYGLQTSSLGQDKTPLLRGMGAQYEFDSYISTEEAFFGAEELKSGVLTGMRRGEMATGSNPQEDSTPKGQRSNFRRTGELMNFDRRRATENPPSQASSGFGLASRQRTQRFETTKGKTLSNTESQEEMGSPKDERGRN